MQVRKREACAFLLSLRGRRNLRRSRPPTTSQPNHSSLQCRRQICVNLSDDNWRHATHNKIITDAKKNIMQVAILPTCQRCGFCIIEYITSTSNHFTKDCQVCNSHTYAPTSLAIVRLKYLAGTQTNTFRGRGLVQLYTPIFSNFRTKRVFRLEMRLVHRIMFGAIFNAFSLNV